MKISSLSVLLFTAVLLVGCAGKNTYRTSCAAELDAAWQELEVAKAKGFAGSVSYSKAVGLITLAKSMQTVENFDNCVRHAKDARFYIAQSKQGQ